MYMPQYNFNLVETFLGQLVKTNCSGLLTIQDEWQNETGCLGKTIQGIVKEYVDSTYTL